MAREIERRNDGLLRTKPVQIQYHGQGQNNNYREEGYYFRVTGLQSSRSLHLTQRSVGPMRRFFGLLGFWNDGPLKQRAPASY